MTFTDKPDRRRPASVFARAALSRLPPLGLLRAALLALLAMLASGWAVVRYYQRPPAPMFVPVPASPAPAPTYDADAGEWPVPDFLLEPDAR